MLLQQALAFSGVCQEDMPFVEGDDEGNPLGSVRGRRPGRGSQDGSSELKLAKQMRDDLEEMRTMADQVWHETLQTCAQLSCPLSLALLFIKQVHVTHTTDS